MASEVRSADWRIACAARSGVARYQLPRSAGTTALPAVTAIELGSSISAPVDVRVTVDAERSGAVVGRGSAATVVGPGQHVAVDIRLGTAVDGGPPDLAGDSCFAGDYCGGDKLDGDPGTLYRCDAPAAPTVRGVCTYGCILRPGLDDTCRGGVASAASEDSTAAATSSTAIRKRSTSARRTEPARSSRAAQTAARSTPAPTTAAGSKIAVGPASRRVTRRGTDLIRSWGMPPVLGRDPAVFEPLDQAETVDGRPFEPSETLPAERYQMLGLLGRGSMGEVRKAFDPPTRTPRGA